jgi:hypothetical protein
VGIELRPRAGQFGCLSFSPDGRWLVGGTGSGDILLFPMRLDELIEKAAGVVGRNMTRREWNQYLPDEPYRKTFPGLPEAPAGSP